jgi:hypothetical protein
MEKELCTAEEFQMDGKERVNKTYTREYKQKFDGIVETKKKVSK